MTAVLADTRLLCPPEGLMARFEKVDLVLHAENLI